MIIKITASAVGKFHDILHCLSFTRRPAWHLTWAECNGANFSAVQYTATAHSYVPKVTLLFVRLKHSFDFEILPSSEAQVIIFLIQLCSSELCLSYPILICRGILFSYRPSNAVAPSLTTAKLSCRAMIQYHEWMLAVKHTYWYIKYIHTRVSYQLSPRPNQCSRHHPIQTDRQSLIIVRDPRYALDRVRPYYKRVCCSLQR